MQLFSVILRMVSRHIPVWIINTKLDWVAPLVADTHSANSTTDIDTHPLKTYICDPRHSFNTFSVPLKIVPYKGNYCTIINNMMTNVSLLDSYTHIHVYTLVSHGNLSTVGDLTYAPYKRAKLVQIIAK